MTLKNNEESPNAVWILGKLEPVSSD